MDTIEFKAFYILNADWNRIQ